MTKVKGRQAEARPTGRGGRKTRPASVDLQAFKILKDYKSNNFSIILAREIGPA
jgi:hypothetical protein